MSISRTAKNLNIDVGVPILAFMGREDRSFPAFQPWDVGQVFEYLHTSVFSSLKWEIATLLPSHGCWGSINELLPSVACRTLPGIE